MSNDASAGGTPKDETTSSGGEFDPGEPLPIFGLGTVLFPGAWLPLRVFEARYVDMTRACLKSGRPFGVCLIVEGREVGQPATPHKVGCLAHIVDCDMQQLGVLQLRTSGGRRFRIKDYSVNSQGLVVANAGLLAQPAAVPLPEEYANCAQRVELIISKHGERVFPAPHLLDDAEWVGFRLAELLPLPLGTRQKLLEMNDPLQRLAVLQQMLTGADPQKA